MPNHHSLAFEHFRAHINDITIQLEGIDACISFVDQNLKTNPAEEIKISDILGAGKRKARTLRTPVKAKHQLLNRLRKGHCEYTFHVVYSYFSAYLHELLREMFNHNPLMVVGKAPGKLDYHDVVRLSNFDTIADHMVDQVFKRLEGTKSTSQLLERILEHTQVMLPMDIADQALMYIEVRHLLVHQAGRIDASFLNKYGNYLQVPVKEGGKFQMNVGFARAATKAVYQLVEYVDLQLVSKGFASHYPRAQNEVEIEEV